MTQASTGLRKALARGQNGTVQTLAEMSNEELLAGMSDEQKTALVASIKPEAKAEMAPKRNDGDDEEEEMAEDGKKKPAMEGDEDGAKAATERAVAVMSCEHAAGRTKLAADLLANDKLSAAEIISILSASAPATTTDPEAAARAEMQAALEANGTSEIEANDGGVSKPEAKSADVWAAAQAKVFGATNPA